jgi:hypothetical protein
VIEVHKVFNLLSARIPYCCGTIQEWNCCKVEIIASRKRIEKRIKFSFKRTIPFMGIKKELQKGVILVDLDIEMEAL